MQPVSVIGGGLAGSEAAWQIARQGVAVRLYEMRPVRPTDAHQTDKLAELVCSNSFRSAAPGGGGRSAERRNARSGVLSHGGGRRGPGAGRPSPGS